MNEQNHGTPVTPLPNPGEGGPVYSGTDAGQSPSVPLPDVGEGGPVYDGSNTSQTPAVPLPNPGEGGPVYDVSDASQTPAVPLPNPGEGGPVYDSSAPSIPVLPLPGVTGPIFGGAVGLPGASQSAAVRFLNAAFGYRPFRVTIRNTQVVNWLSYASLSGYLRVPAGYHTVTVSGTDGYIYLQKTMPFQSGDPATIAIINTASGLDLLQITDACCAPTGGMAAFRVSNLALNSEPLDVLLGDGRVVYADVRYKETTAFKRIVPGAYQFFLAETSLTPIPAWMDIETLDSAFLGMHPVSNTVSSLYLNVAAGSSYTVFLLSSGTSVNAIQTLTAQDR